MVEQRHRGGEAWARRALGRDPDGHPDAGHGRPRATRLIRAARARAGRPRTPIVALTANALKGKADRCLEAGMDDYLTKPLTLDRLREAVARWAIEATSTAGDRPLGGRGHVFGGNKYGGRPRARARFPRCRRPDGRRDRRPLARIATGNSPSSPTSSRAPPAPAGAMAFGDLAATVEKSGRGDDVEALEAGMAAGRRRAQRLHRGVVRAGSAALPVTAASGAPRRS